MRNEKSCLLHWICVGQVPLLCDHTPNTKLTHTITIDSWNDIMVDGIQAVYKSVDVVPTPKQAVMTT